MKLQRESRRQEERAAKVYGGRRNAGSGNQPWRKNDVRTPEESWEMKLTRGTYFKLRLDDLLQAEKLALLDGRRFRLGLQMGGRNWVIMSEEDYLELRHGSEAES